MANIGYFPINTNKEYETVENVTGITFTTGTKYILQVQSAEPFYFCVSNEIPESGGFKVGLEPFTYTPQTGAKLYVKTFGKAYLNIAE